MSGERHKRLALREINSPHLLMSLHLYCSSVWVRGAVRSYAFVL